MKILVINGPNLNFLGIRQIGVYGSQDYEYLKKVIEKQAEELGVEVDIFRSNSEGAIIDRIQKAYTDETSGIIINPGAYTHYSYAIADALASLESVKKIEVHITNIYKREEFRHKSVTAPVCDGQISGLGFNGYMYAMETLVDMINGW
jgi:3-dehydroquinate dehydratase-2